VVENTRSTEMYVTNIVGATSSKVISCDWAFYWRTTAVHSVGESWTAQFRKI